MLPTSEGVRNIPRYWNVVPEQKGESYACPQEQASHMVLGRFNIAVVVTSRAPSREEFRQHLRRLAVSAVQVLLEHVMREELDESHGGLVG